MKLTRPQKRYAIAASVLLLLIITNPSISAFKAYRGSDSYRGLIREHNYFVCSVYQDSTYDNENDIQHKERYFGVIDNFWIINPDKPLAVNTDSVSGSYSRKLTISEFAAKIKKKYPAYDEVDDKVLVNKILTKYPVYKDNVDTSSISQ